MEIHFKLMHPDVTKELMDRMGKKIRNIAKLIDEGKYEAQAFVEITKETGSQHSDTAWKAIINLDARGDRFHAETVQDTPEKAGDYAVRELQSELRTHHAKERTLRRKGGGFWKGLIQGDLSAP